MSRNELDALTAAIYERDVEHAAERERLENELVDVQGRFKGAQAAYHSARAEVARLRTTLEAVQARVRACRAEFPKDSSDVFDAVEDVGDIATAALAAREAGGEG